MKRGNTVHVGLRVPADLSDKLKESAEVNYRSLSNEIVVRLLASFETNPGSATNTPGAVQTSLAEAEHEESTTTKPTRNSPQN